MNLVTRILLALAMFAIPTAVAAAELSTGTDAHRDINGAQVDKMRDVKGVRYHLAEGAVVLLMPNDEWAVNHTGEGLEFLSDKRKARLGVEAHLAGSQWSPASALQATLDSLKKAHGGTWTTPESVNVAGIPALKASGTDVFGNYYFEIYGVERAGIQYLVWMRTPFQNRWNTKLNADVAWVINNLHPSSQTVMQTLNK